MQTSQRSFRSISPFVVFDESGDVANARTPLNRFQPVIDTQNNPRFAMRTANQDDNTTERAPEHGRDPMRSAKHAQTDVQPLQAIAGARSLDSSVPGTMRNLGAQYLPSSQIIQEVTETEAGNRATKPLLPSSIADTTGAQPSFSDMSSEETEVQDAVKTHSQNQVMWNPFWLRKAWLIAYALVFGALLIAVLVLYLLSIRRNGLEASKSTTGMTYLWKFLPTAILVAMLSLWNPVDYFTRLLQPWKNLSKGPVTASRSLLLDRVSPLQPVILISAIKNMELPIVLALSVTMALTAVKIVSTGLLTVELTLMSVSNVSSVRVATIDPILWNSTNDDFETLSLYSGIRRGNLAQPAWTAIDFVAEPFKLPEKYATLPNTTYTAYTTGLFPNLACEEAKFVGTPECDGSKCGTFWSTIANMTVLSATCEVRIERPLTMQEGKSYTFFKGENYKGDVQQVLCANKPAFVVSVTNVDANINLLNYSALLCRPSFEIKKIPVTVTMDESDQQNYGLPIPTTDSDSQMQGMDANAIFSYIVNTTSGANLPWYRPSGNLSEENTPFLTMAATSVIAGEPGASYLKPFLDVSVLNKSVSDTFVGAFSIVVSQQMLRIEETTIEGDIQYPENRLHVKQTPTIIITTILLICAVSAIILIWVSPVNVVPHNPNSIIGVAATLGSIKRDVLFGHESFADVVRTLKGQTFNSTVSASRHTDVTSSTFDIITHSRFPAKKLGNSTSKAKDPLQTHRWSPLTLRSWVRTSAIVLCMVTVAALEALQRSSDRSDGLMPMSPNDSRRLWVTVVPALILTGIALLHSSIHFNIALMSPYYALSRESGAIARRSIATDYLGSTPLFTIWPAIYKKHHATAISGFAAVVGAILTIVVSGLYGIEEFGASTKIELATSTTWNRTWTSTYCAECSISKIDPQDAEGGDNSASYVLNYNTWRNQSHPLWTYDDLALPSLSISSSTASVTGQGKIEMIVPAQRAMLNCTTTSPTNVVAGLGGSTRRVDKEYTFQGTDIYTTVPRTCFAKPSNETDIVVHRTNFFTSYGGGIMQLRFSDNDTVELFDPEASSNWKDAGQVQDCPSLFLFFGSFPDSIPKFSYETDKTNTTYIVSSNYTSSESQITTLACAQRLQEIDTKVTLLLPDLTVDTSNPPIPDESSMRYIGGVHQYPVVKHLQNLGILSTNTTLNKEAATLSSFFAAIIYGKDGIPPNELVGEDNIPRLTSAVSKMYSRYMAQVASLKMRIPLNSTTPPQTLQASLTQPTSRLVQHSAPKLALQILLGVMMLCGILSWVLMPNVHILPHDPCSIAGTACLVADKEFWGNGMREWEEDQRFKLETRDGRFGIYAVGVESRRLIGN